MAKTVIGSEVRERGKTLEHTTKNHREAVHAAQDRSRSASTPSATPSATVFTELAMDFDDARAATERATGRMALAKQLTRAATLPTTGERFEEGDWFGRFLDGEEEPFACQQDEFSNHFSTNSPTPTE